MCSQECTTELFLLLSGFASHWVLLSTYFADRKLSVINYHGQLSYSGIKVFCVITYIVQNNQSVEQNFDL